MYGTDILALSATCAWTCVLSKHYIILCIWEFSVLQTFEASSWNQRAAPVICAGKHSWPIIQVRSVRRSHLEIFCIAAPSTRNYKTPRLDSKITITKLHAITKLHVKTPVTTKAHVPCPQVSSTIAAARSISRSVLPIVQTSPGLTVALPCHYWDRLSQIVFYMLQLNDVYNWTSCARVGAGAILLLYTRYI